MKESLSGFSCVCLLSVGPGSALCQRYKCSLVRGLLLNINESFCWIQNTAPLPSQYSSNHYSIVDEASLVYQNIFLFAYVTVVNGNSDLDQNTKRTIKRMACSARKPKFSAGGDTTGNGLRSRAAKVPRKTRPASLLESGSTAGLPATWHRAAFRAAFWVRCDHHTSIAGLRKRQR